jgi:hypothetical protein
LLPMQTPPALPEPDLEESDFEGYVEAEPEPAPPRPRVVEVRVEEVNDLSDMRMRPRRVIVVK